MDIATHAMAGTIIAIPFLPTSPLTACSFIFGSVLPDLDALSRLFGKTAFLRWHQTYTHSLPIILAGTALFWLTCRWYGIYEVWVPLALCAGLLLHAFMDATNTYGIALFAPFCRRRFCTKWLFFMDGIVIAVSIGCFSVTLFCLYADSPRCWMVSIGYGGFLAVYWSLRALLYWRANQFLTQEICSLIPSAIFPWQFFGYAVCDDKVQLFTLNGFTGASRGCKTQQTYDFQYQNLLAGVTEYRMMRELSNGYFVIDAKEQGGKLELNCRDLRTRNFGGRFGQLELSFNAEGKVERKNFHV